MKNLFGTVVLTLALASCSSTPDKSAAIEYPAYDPDPAFDYDKALEYDYVDKVAKNVTEPPTLEQYLTASKSGNKRVLKFYVDRGLLDPTIHFDKEKGSTPLIVIAPYGYERVKALLDLGYDANAQEHESPGYSPLLRVLEAFKRNFWTTYHHRSESEKQAWVDEVLRVMQLLVDNGASVNARGSDRWTPLSLAEFAVKEYPLSAVPVRDWLIANGAVAEEERFLKLDIYLWAAIEMNDVEAARSALARGASTYERHPYEYITPLRAAVRANLPEITELILQYPCRMESLYAGEDRGSVAILDETQNPKIIELLKRRGALGTETLQRFENQRDAMIAQTNETRRRAKAHAAWREEWTRTHNEKTRKFQQAQWARADKLEYDKVKAEEERIESQNAFIDQINKAMGSRHYQRYDSSGQLTWYKRVD